MLLRSHHVFSSKDIGEIEHMIRTVAAGRLASAREIDGEFGFGCRSVATTDISLFYVSNDMSTVVDFAPVDYLRFVFQVRETSRVALDGADIVADPTGPGYVMPADRPAREDHPDGHRSLALRVDPAALNRRLSHLLGEEVSGPLWFEQPTRSDVRFVEYIRQPLIAAAREMNHLEGPYLHAYLADLQAITLTRLLLHARHAQSHRFETAPPRTTPERLSLVEDYIMANWNRTIQMEELVALTSVSGRTLHRDFVDRFGETPGRYIKRIRLLKARSMLKAASGHSVMAIALACGFSSLGHFADAYRRMFGELPSSTRGPD